MSRFATSKTIAILISVQTPCESCEGGMAVGQVEIYDIQTHKVCADAPQDDSNPTILQHSRPLQQRVEPVFKKGRIGMLSIRLLTRVIKPKIVTWVRGHRQNLYFFLFVTKACCVRVWGYTHRDRSFALLRLYLKSGRHHIQFDASTLRQYTASRYSQL